MAAVAGGGAAVAGASAAKVAAAVAMTAARGPKANREAARSDSR
jgi:hypothetical protein